MTAGGCGIRWKEEREDLSCKFIRKNILQEGGTFNDR
jgi:hypothetical protein